MQLLRICLFCFCFLLLSLPAAARQVDVLWQLQADETLEEGKQRATQKGWAQAVFQEALSLLPGELDPERKQVLRDFLAPMAERFVLDSSETRLSESVKGMHLGLDVAVDDAPLQQLLQRIGVFYTAGAVLNYSLTLKGVPQESVSRKNGEKDLASWENPEHTDQEPEAEEKTQESQKDALSQRIARLELLSGVRQEEGALPTLSLDYKKATWQGALEASRGSYDVAGSDLQTVWLSLWGWYFTVHGLESSTDAEQGDVQTAELLVQGWQAPDGVYAFEQVLKGFRPALLKATLKTLGMRPQGVTGVWELKLRDVEAFKARMQAYMGQHNLQWRLDEKPSEESGASPQDAAADAASGSLGTQAPSGQEAAVPETPTVPPRQQSPENNAASTAPPRQQPPEADAASALQTPWQSSTPLPDEEDFPSSNQEVH